MAVSSLRVVSMSRTSGIFSNTTGSSVSRAAAIAGSAAFLAPETRTVPSSGLPPRITNLSIENGLFYVVAIPIVRATGNAESMAEPLARRFFGEPNRPPHVAARGLERSRRHPDLHSGGERHQGHGHAVPGASQSLLGLSAAHAGDILQ